jgi:chromosome segregation ATPase
MSTPDPIQAAAMECVKECAKKMAAVFGYPSDDASYGHVYRMAETVVATAMRELVAREQLKDIHAVADLREDNARLRERVAELEKDNETLRRGARIAFDQEDHAEKCVESLETQLAAMTKERDDLLAENARIKANHGCARNQGTTQFCAEVLSVQKERDNWHAMYREEADKRAKMEAQRDELRQHADALADDLQVYLKSAIALSDKSPVTKATTRLLAAYRASQQRPGI